jgi:hypothetical protein
LEVGFVADAGFIVPSHGLGSKAWEDAGLAQLHLHPVFEIKVHQRDQPVFPSLLPEGGDAALKEFKAFVEREAKGFRLGVEVGVKCTGGETEVEPLGRAMGADSKIK